MNNNMNVSADSFEPKIDIDEMVNNNSVLDVGRVVIATEQMEVVQHFSLPTTKHRPRLKYCKV